MVRGKPEQSKEDIIAVNWVRDYGGLAWNVSVKGMHSQLLVVF